jgi:hypothetical protein
MENEISNIEKSYTIRKEDDGVHVLYTVSTDWSVEKLKSMSFNVFVKQHTSEFATQINTKRK